MTAGFDRIEFARLARGYRLAGASIRRVSVWLPAILLLGSGAWLVLPASDGHVAQGSAPRLELASLQPDPSEPSAGAAPIAAQLSAPAELDRLQISSQTWRRGGLGSKALVTFTLRNGNDYAVKDVEIVCAFSRRDGSHLTDRRRMLPDTVSTRSRKTFARVPVGFVNVNAAQAKCSLAAAQRV
jgi:hypothetical protein